MKDDAQARSYEFTQWEVIGICAALVGIEDSTKGKTRPFVEEVEDEFMAVLHKTRKAFDRMHSPAQPAPETISIELTVAEQGVLRGALYAVAGMLEIPQTKEELHCNDGIRSARRKLTSANQVKHVIGAPEEGDIRFTLDEDEAKKRPYPKPTGWNVLSPTAWFMHFFGLRVYGPPKWSKDRSPR